MYHIVWFLWVFRAAGVGSKPSQSSQSLIAVSVFQQHWLPQHLQGDGAQKVGGHRVAPQSLLKGLRWTWWRAVDRNGPVGRVGVLYHKQPPLRGPPSPGAPPAGPPPEGSDRSEDPMHHITHHIMHHTMQNRWKLVKNAISLTRMYLFYTIWNKIY